MLTYATHRQIKESDLRHLYDAVGWTGYTQNIEDLTQLLTHARQVVSAWDNDLLVGLARTVGDGVYVELIQDILVLPDYQKQGIGRTLLETVINNLNSSIRQAFLLTDDHPANQNALSFYDQHPKLTKFSNSFTTGYNVDL